VSTGAHSKVYIYSVCNSLSHFSLASVLHLHKMARRNGGKRRKLMGMQLARGAAKQLAKRIKGKLYNKAANAVMAAPGRVYDSVSSAMRKRKRRVQGAQQTIKSAKRKLNFGRSAEGQSLKLNGVTHINLGGRNQIKSISRSVRPLWAKHLFEYSNGFRALETTTLGYHQLNAVNDGTLPLQCWDLTWISQMKHPTDAFFAGNFASDGKWANLGFANELKDVDTGPGNGAHFNRCTQWLHRKVKVRLLLYGRQRASTTYKIMFFRVSDEENAPNRLDINNERDEINKNIWYPIIAKMTTNPIAGGHNATNFRQGTKRGASIRIIRQHTISIPEQLGTEDVIKKINVNFTGHINKIKIHNEANVDKPSYTDITAVVPKLTSHLYDNATQSVLPQQRIYMAIMATNYGVTGEANYEAPSYDMSLLQYIDASNLHGWPE